MRRSTFSSGNKRHQSRVRNQVSHTRRGHLGRERHSHEPVEQGKKIADKALSAARDSWNKGQAATEQTAQAGQEGFLASADGIGIKLPKKAPARAEIREIKPSHALSKTNKHEDDSAGPHGWFLIADGSDQAEVAAIQKAVGKDRGKCKIVAPKVGGAKMLEGSVLKPDGQRAGTPSQIFDAVAIILSEEACQP